MSDQKHNWQCGYDEYQGCGATFFFDGDDFCPPEKCPECGVIFCGLASRRFQVVSLTSLENKDSCEVHIGEEERQLFITRIIKSAESERISRKEIEILIDFLKQARLEWLHWQVVRDGKLQVRLKDGKPFFFRNEEGLITGECDDDVRSDTWGNDRLFAENKQLHTDLAHMREQAGADSCAEYAAENKRLSEENEQLRSKLTIEEGETDQ